MASLGTTYVISDVHGHLADLERVLAEAGLASDGRWSGGDADLWVLGDLLDRGPDGIGVVRLLRSLQEQAPDHVHVLMGNHEALAIGCRLFPDTRFAEIWLVNGGLAQDQMSLTDEELAWLRALPVAGSAAGHLLLHSDTLGYLEWGSSIEEVNATVTGLLADDEAQTHWDVFAALTDRFDFLGEDGPAHARRLLDTLGGDRVVHGHSIIGSLVDKPSESVDGPLTYADDLAMGIDGGRYDGGPLLLVELARAE